MNYTPAARIYFRGIDRSMHHACDDIEQAQKATLRSLLNYGRRTDYGRHYDFQSISSTSQWKERIPIAAYESIRPLVERMIAGEADLLLPGRCRRYAQSSGTSGGASKFIPLPDRSLKRCHYRGGSEVVASYLANYPDSRLFAGKSLILGGSYATDMAHPRQCRIGDLSASLIDCINPLANLMRVPSKRVALMADWNKKLPALVSATLRADVTNLSGVPSWFFTVIERVMERAGADELHQVWPHLEVFFHGGISFAPYRRQYDRLIDPSRMRYMETYNASEGFFALQDDPEDPSMLLLMDVDVYYEFIPIDLVDSDSPTTLSAWEVIPGETYAMVITSSNGLWRYSIGDTVEVTSAAPLKIRIAGRTRSFINAFGEELMVHNADAAIAAACEANRCEVTDYTACPVYADTATKGHHRWLVEFDHAPESIDRFARDLDLQLQRVNTDYRAKRAGGIFLGPPEVITLESGTFNRYLADTGKLGGQRKVPRLSNSPAIVDRLLNYLNPQQSK